MRLLCVLLLLSVTLLAQPTTKGWQELTISDGLSQGMIYDLKQDPQGFIWVATKDGLNRYDGHNFTVFTHDPYNPYSLSDDNCSSLLIDSRGRLWVGTLNRGLNLFDAQTQRFYHLSIRDRAATNAGNYEVRKLVEDPEGNIWAGTDKANLFKISLPSSLKTGYPIQANFTAQVQLQQLSFMAPGFNSNAQIGYINFRSDGQAIISAIGKLFTVDWRHPAAITEPGWFGPGVTPFQARLGNTPLDYWFEVAHNNLIAWHQGKRNQKVLPASSDQGDYLEVIDDRTLALATNRFIWLMSPAKLYAQDSLTARNAFAAVPPAANRVTKLIYDQTGNLWVGTAGYGLRVFNPKIKQFGAYLPNTSLSYVYQDRQQRTYVRDGFHYRLLDRATNRSTPLLAEVPPGRYYQAFLMQDRRGFFWVSSVNDDTGQGELFQYSTDWKLLKRYPLPPPTTFGFYLNQTVEDRQGKLWIGATNGNLLRFDPQTEAFTVFSYKYLLPQSGTDIETHALYFDWAGTLWIGTTRGLIRADNPLTKPTFTLYKNNPTDRQSLSNDVVSSIVDDPNEPARYLWVSTKGGGLERLEKQTWSDRSEGRIHADAGSGHFAHFTQAQGLPNKVVYGILVDEFKHLWLSTNRGLAQFNPKTFKFRNYIKADGLQDDEFNTGSFFKTASGELLFGGVNGLNSFRAREVTGKSGPAPLAHIVGLKVNNEPVTVGGPDGILTQSLENTQQLDLSYQQNGLTLEFAVMDYTNAPKNRYRYRLVGIDDDWVEAGTNRFANYAQLPSGNYNLQMMGSADGEVWSNPVTLAIRMHPPVYRTWWAYLLYALVLVAIAWQLYRFQTQRWRLQQRVEFEQKEASRLAELDGLKTQFFTSISHEFRTPLTLILGPLDELKQRFQSKQVVTLTEPVVTLMKRNGDRLLGLINQLLDLSKLEAGQLRAEPVDADITAFFRTLASSFSSLATSRHILFTFEQLETGRWAAFDQDKLEKITTNLLSNAFKFTPTGNEVCMRIAYPDRHVAGNLVLTIQDTGIGIAPAHLNHIFERFYQIEGQTNRPYEGTGIGLALVNELVNVLKGTIRVDSTEGVGTTFTVTLPLVETAPSVPAPESIPQFEAPRTETLAHTNPLVEWPVYSSGQTWSAKEIVSTPVETTPPAVSDNILLIIDDNADIRSYVRRIFEADYQIIEAIDGQDGLEKATASLPNIIICDLMMPRLDGFGFCRSLKTQPATSHIPVVMLTAKATVEDRIEGFELGADDYLTKPFNQAEIQARVRNLIQQRQRLYQWFSTSRVVSDSLQVANQDPMSTLLVSEQQLIDRLTQVVNEHIDEPEFSVEMLAEAVNMSRSQLHRKLKAVLDTSPTNLIRKVRLTKAAELLLAGNQSITLIAYAVGIDNLSYFAKVFQEQYGVLPSQYGRTEKPLSDS